MTAQQIKTKYINKATFIPACITFFLGIGLTAFTDTITNQQSIKQLTQQVANLNVAVDNMNRILEARHEARNIQVNELDVRITTLETEFKFFNQQKNDRSNHSSDN